MILKYIFIFNIIIIFLKSAQSLETCIYKGVQNWCLPIDGCDDNYDDLSTCKNNGNKQMVCCEIQKNPASLEIDIIGGTVVKNNELPHMALLGYGKSLNEALWSCGGSLISDQWVLTAAHCLWNRNTNSDVKYVRLGGKDVNSTIDPALLYTIEKYIKHSEYNATQKYNDIALLKLNKKVSNVGIVPACIHDLKNKNSAISNITEAVAAGWGYINNNVRSNKLLKVTLNKFDYAECRAKYRRDRRLPQSLKRDTQICYGSRTEKKDTCLGDSGGPLHIKNSGDACTYVIIGVTSFGKPCGQIGIPAVYTNVSAYANWIIETIKEDKQKGWNKPPAK